MKTHTRQEAVSGLGDSSPLTELFVYLSSGVRSIFPSRTFFLSQCIYLSFFLYISHSPCLFLCLYSFLSSSLALSYCSCSYLYSLFFCLDSWNISFSPFTGLTIDPHCPLVFGKRSVSVKPWSHYVVSDAE